MEDTTKKNTTKNTATKKKATTAKKPVVKKEFKSITEPIGGKVDEVRKMGRPKALKKPKASSVYIYEEQIEKVCEVVGGDTPNEFVKKLYEVASEDIDKMIELMTIVYGKKSREARIAKMIKMEQEA